jgi:aminoglycoside phosphotransferase (APT) family kinase protein
MKPGKEFRELVETELGKEYSWNRLEKGLNEVYVIESGEESLVVKEHTNDENDLEWFRSEPRIYQLLSNNDSAPSPEIVHVDFSMEKHPNCFYVMEKIEGENPEKFIGKWTVKSWKNLLYSYGEILSQIHEAREFETYGLLAGENGDIVPVDDAEKWSWSINGMKESLMDIIGDKWGDPPEIDAPSMEWIHEKVPGEPGAVLVHSDNRLDNLIVRDGRINGFLDWSHPRSGHGLYDLVRAEYLLIEWDLKKEGQERDELRQELYRGYGRQDLLEDSSFEKLRQFYRFCTVLWIAAGFPNWSSDWEKEARQEMRSEIIERLEQEKL